jgi:ribosomal 50S subunit-associated protein YjgA (DUF615 family)
MKSYEEFKPETRRPSTLEGLEITQEIVRRHKLEYISRSFNVSINAVAKWLTKTTNLFTRMKRFMDDLVEDGDRDIAMRLARYFCEPVDCIPTSKPPKQIGLLSLLQAACDDSKHSAGVQIDIADMIADQVCETHELEKALESVQREIESADRVRGQLRFLLREAERSGGKVVLDMNQLNKRILQTSQP